VPDLQSPFSRPSKEHGFLVTKAFVGPESVFRIARVEVLKHYQQGRLVSPTVPTAPGSDVLRASPQLLRQLLGEGDVRLGTLQQHPDVPVALRSDKLLSMHLAVLGMTGSGESVTIKVLLHGLAHDPMGKNLRLVVIDTHGEYASAARRIAPVARIIDVRLRRSVLDEEVVRDLLRRSAAMSRLWASWRRSPKDLPPAGPQGVSGRPQGGASTDDRLAAKLTRFVHIVRDADDLCLWADEGAVIIGAQSGSAEHLRDPGLYVLDLRYTASLKERAGKAAAVMGDVFQRSKQSGDDVPALVVLDEAQNYVPDQQTGWLARVRP